MFENIECEWPLFFCYLILNYAFQNNKERVSEYANKLEELMVKGEDGVKLVPELYTVPQECVNDEYKVPGSALRKAVGRVRNELETEAHVSLCFYRFRHLFFGLNHCTSLENYFKKDFLLSESSIL